MRGGEERVNIVRERESEIERHIQTNTDTPNIQIVRGKNTKKRKEIEREKFTLFFSCLFIDPTKYNYFLFNI